MKNDFLDSASYEHPLDRTLLSALKKIPFIETIGGWVIDYYSKTDYLTEGRGNYFEVTEKSYPRVDKLRKIATDRLSIDFDFPIFIKREWNYNAYTTGLKSPVMVLHSSIVEDFTDDELLSIIGHEMGHRKSKHTIYHFMARNIIGLVRNFGYIGEFALQTLIIALKEWERKSELTADRAGYIACQNKEASMNALFKLMGVPIVHNNQGKYNFQIEDALIQAQEHYDHLGSSKYQKFVYALLTSQIDHPWTIERISEINKWEGIKRL